MHEVISLAVGTSMTSKAVSKIYTELIDKFENEFNILLYATREKLGTAIKNELLLDLILKNREGKIKLKPGYDGEYGKAILGDVKVPKQSKLFS